jgi:hypothetical protein
VLAMEVCGLAKERPGRAGGEMEWSESESGCESCKLAGESWGQSGLGAVDVGRGGEGAAVVEVEGECAAGMLTRGRWSARRNWDEIFP